jgi:hypothetical protein
MARNPNILANANLEKGKAARRAHRYQARRMAQRAAKVNIPPRLMAA